MADIVIQRMRQDGWYAKYTDGLKNSGGWVLTDLPKNATMQDVRNFYAGYAVRYANAREVNQLLRQLT